MDGKSAVMDKLNSGAVIVSTAYPKIGGGHIWLNRIGDEYLDTGTVETLLGLDLLTIDFSAKPKSGDTVWKLK